MAGQFQDEAPDGSFRVTIGSADDPRADGGYFVTQQDAEHHQTDIYDSNDNLLGSSEKGKGLGT